LTLLYAAGSADREVLVDVLASALDGGLLLTLQSEAAEQGVPEAEEFEDLGELDDEYFEEEELELADGELGEPLLDMADKGRMLAHVIAVLKRWLRECPAGPLELGPRAGNAIAPLVCCWSATVTHALASEPLTLAELDRAVPILDRETVEEHVEAMERAGLAEAVSADGDGETRYALTEWMRRGFAPIAAAARMELHYPEPDLSPPEALDVDAAFQLVLPLLWLPAEVSGTCRLDVRIPSEDDFAVGAMAEVENGQIVSASPLLDETTPTLITGTPVQWLDTLADPPSLQLGVGGDLTLVHWLLSGLHEVLFRGVEAD
jgi:DNA-binding HxlR family transcriptional regulator